MFGYPPFYLPPHDARAYRVLSVFLYVIFIAILIYGTLTFLFPYQRYNFDFNNPNATKNNLFEPHLQNFSSVEKGKVAALGGMSLYANNPQVLESGDITILPSDSTDARHLAGASVQIRRGWAATFFPEGETLEIPQVRIVEYQGNFYEDRNGILYPVVSEAAAKSWIPENAIVSLAPSSFESTAKSEELIGFRPGTLLAYADGVFFVTEEATIRPFGSAEVLLRSGYSFNHVIPASGEDVGIYKRGKIILPGELHLGGTIFQDTDTQTLFLFRNRELRSLAPSYGEFLTAHNDVITFSRHSQQQLATCALAPKILQKSYTCEVLLESLKGPGNDYQITLLSPSQDTDIQMVV